LVVLLVIIFYLSDYQCCKGWYCR